MIVVSGIVYLAHICFQFSHFYSFTNPSPNKDLLKEDKQTKSSTDQEYERTRRNNVFWRVHPYLIFCFFFLMIKREGTDVLNLQGVSSVYPLI